MIQYGGTLKTKNGHAIEVSREGPETVLRIDPPTIPPGAGPSEALAQPVLNYPQLLSLIARLQEAAKDAAGAKR